MCTYTYVCKDELKQAITSQIWTPNEQVTLKHMSSPMGSNQANTPTHYTVFQG